jgi:1-deoxy-D-xylulose-5-phosphate reductoisomerase
MSSATQANPRRLIVLGSTGSIGVNTLAVVDHLNRTGAARIEVVGLAAGNSVKPLIEQARRFGVRHVAIANPIHVKEVRRALPDAQVHAGESAALDLVESLDATDVAAAMVGAAGLPATLAAARKGCIISLANKETLVAAGALVKPVCREHGARLIPVDSEHSAIFQCLQTGMGYGVSGIADPGQTIPHTPYPIPDSRFVRRVVLTASGGPFRTVDKQTMHDATVEQALKHPTWSMGPKITIDSATMMNKALEIIEAHWLFDLPADKITVLVHPQSIVHSFVEFADHSVLAQLGPPDMKTPIQYALTYPHRVSGCSEHLDWLGLRRLEFEPPDTDKFTSLKLAYDVIEAGGTAGAVFNAANEAAVAAFLERKVRFGRITELVAEALSAIDIRPADSLDAIHDADREARAFVNERIGVTV